MPVVRDREDVVAGASVVARERPGASSPSEFVVWVCSAARSQSPSRSRASPRGEPIAVARRRTRTIAGHGTRPRRCPWRISRSRSTSSSGGSTRSGSAGASCSSGASRPRRASPSSRCPRPPSLRGRRRSRTRRSGDQEEPRRARRGGEEGRAPERDRAAARLGELRRDHLDLHEEVRHRHHERQPQRKLVGRRTRRSSRSRATPAHPTSSTSTRRSRSPAPSRACTAGTTSRTTRPSRGR